MGLDSTPSSQRIQIGFFGQRNAGKSSLVNAITNQKLSVVSDVAGTTTDPVKKAMELLPLGPVVIVDTPGFDDTGSLGEQRIQKTRRILASSDLAVLVVDATKGFGDSDKQLCTLFDEAKLPYLIAYNKCELLESIPPSTEKKLYVSAKTGYQIHELKEALSKFALPAPITPLCGDLFSPGDLIVLVIPIDSSAPKGRIILPQQMAIRDILDHDGIPVCIKPDGLSEFMKKNTIPPSLVITDSQAFLQVAAIVPPQIPLTSFSILMARYRGFLEESLRGVAAIDRLAKTLKGGRLLIAEGCTHHRQCGDIGTDKLPRWLRDYIGRDIDIAFCSGVDFPEDVSSFDAVIHCGGCMLNKRELLHRRDLCKAQQTPFTNYGITIAMLRGILARATQPFDLTFKESTHEPL